MGTDRQSNECIWIYRINATIGATNDRGDILKIIYIQTLDNAKYIFL